MVTESAFFGSSKNIARTEIPQEFRKCHLERPPFACHPPAEGWKQDDADNTEKSPIEYTLIFVVDRKKNKVLLGYKRRGVGVDLYNGFGGKVESGESIEECAARELQEESGLTPEPDGIYYKGCLFSSRPRSALPGDKHVIINIHFFGCDSWTGEPIPTEEMIPQWFDISAGNSETDHPLPINQMWPEATFYLLPVLQSILRDNRDDLLLSRINYGYIPKSASPNLLLPALEGKSIRRHLTKDDDKDDVAERLISWWMCFAPKVVSNEIEYW
ncbi:uncharacterized protein L201_001549 [Kwoniella dendrophila CBS 6074]|uniref:Nudix hydrolase domain-containing protein n=1 Tax=Kwoniella dendrophila CBS 6074 TaxID=1295534 RepID=A0AAX4JMR5_9TREE